MRWARLGAALLLALHSAAAEIKEESTPGAGLRLLPVRPWVHRAQYQLEMQLAGRGQESVPLYSKRRANGGYTRNDDGWAATLQGLTGLAAWNSHSGFQIGRAAVTSRHLVTCAHASWPPERTEFEFVARNNEVVVRRSVDVQRVAETDILVVLLDEALPSIIEPLPVLSEGAMDALRRWHGARSLDRVTCFTSNQKGEAFLVDWVGESFARPQLRFSSPPWQPAAEWHRPLVTGDSGHIAALIVDNQLVLVTAWTTPVSGPSYALNFSGIQEAIDTLNQRNGVAARHPLTEYSIPTAP